VTIQKVNEHDYINESELKLILQDALLIGPFFEPLMEAVMERNPTYHGTMKQIEIVKAM
jgi:hypothetical protein